MSGFGTAPWGSAPWGEGIEPPFVGNWCPKLSERLARLDIVGFDVVPKTWPVVLLKLVVRAVEVETVWTTEHGFSSLYKHASARLPLPDNGHRYVLRRAGGWPGCDVQIIVTATDLAGASTVASR